MLVGSSFGSYERGRPGFPCHAETLLNSGTDLEVIWTEATVRRWERKIESFGLQQNSAILNGRRSSPAVSVARESSPVTLLRR